MKHESFLFGNVREPSSIDTPSVVVNLETLRHNIADWATWAKSRHVKLRPHVKTHKCFEIADMQVQAGASGLTVATLSEAEALISRGYDNVFQAYPLWLSEPKRERLIRILEAGKLTVGVDSVDAVKQLAHGLSKSLRKNLSVMVEVNSGQNRTGVHHAAVVKVAKSVLKNKLEFAGVFTHGGHAYTGAVGKAARDEVTALTRAAEALHAKSIHVPTISAGSTPTAKQSSEYPVNEQRPGVYVFGDNQQLKLGSVQQNEIALFVVATVVSSHAGRVVLDAGSKVLGVDKPEWVRGYGLLPDYPDATIVRLSEHHAVVEGLARLPEQGEQVAIIPNHVCITANLVDEFLVASRGEIVDLWDVSLRGLNK